MNKFVKVMSTYNNSHPWTVLRASEFIKWEGSEEYKLILKGERNFNREENLEDFLACSVCGNRLGDSDKFCGKCGAKVD